MSHSRKAGGRGARSRLACALAVGATALMGGAAGTAVAQEPVDPEIPDPQTTNIPYTAWAGTQIRFVKCSPDLEGINRNGLFAEVESWSGNDDGDSEAYRPRVIEESVAFFRDDDDEETRCVRFNAVTLGDGLARIKLKVFDGPDRVEIFEHQFLAIWLQLEDLEIDEVGADDPTGGPEGSDSEVGDPDGDGQFVPSGNNGRVQVELSGSFPHRLGPAGRFVLPYDWEILARALATEYDETSEDPEMRWDIHDDRESTEGNVAGSCEGGDDGNEIDAVDNCTGGDDFGPFSRVYGDAVDDATGPFDPLRLPTLLSDGKLDEGDAPMPAARVDIEIEGNTGDDDDISGAGALEAADKTLVYSRDGNGGSGEGNLYAPYYVQWIPATSAEEIDAAASGTDWFLQNNFPAATYGPYDNWETIPLTTATGTDTGCNRNVGFPGGADDDDPRQTPDGDQRVAVYTDEHGEAQVEFNPYAGGFYFDGLGDDVLNDNGGCDLQDVDTLGTAEITATAKYPSQPTDFFNVESDTLTKTIGNEFDKSLDVYAKQGDDQGLAQIVVAHGQDIDGEPFAGERVCFYVDDEADSYRLFSGETGDDDRFDVETELAETPGQIDPDARCAVLDENGNAAIEVFNSDDQNVNVIAEYVDEGILRDIDVIFGEGDDGNGTSTTPPGGGTTTAPGGTTTTPPATTPPTVRQVVQTVGEAESGRLLGAVKGVSGDSRSSARIAASKVVRTKKGRFLVVEVASAERRAEVRVRMKLRSGKVRRATRTVKTNKAIRVMKLGGAVKVKTVKVALAG